jgi:RNA polymerase sigma-70 factor (ECF subfamily)
MAACPQRGLIITSRNAASSQRRHILATRKELSDFLAEVERRAFKHALFAVRDRDTALDVVQDAMSKLSEKYGDRPSEEFPMLFQRILQNAIHDVYRRQKVRSLWVSPLSALRGSDPDDDDSDPLETLLVGDDSNQKNSPAGDLERAQTLGLIEKALEALPARQREAFLLRYWEELDVAEAAAVMGCSEGSVKTHCSRATHAIAAFLKRKGFEP